MPFVTEEIYSALVPEDESLMISNWPEFKEEWAFTAEENMVEHMKEIIRGVKGIGDKTAINLLTQYETIEDIYEHIDEIKGKMKEKLEADKENAFISKEIATIYRDVPLNVI